MTAQEQLARMRPEMRYLRIRNAQLERARLSHKDRADKLKQENGKLEKEISRLNEELEKARGELEKTRRQRDKYKGMIFKAVVVERKDNEYKKKKKLGGQLGHRGTSRQVPQEINQTERIYFHHCPDCGNPVDRSKSLETHTVEDIPCFCETKPTVTCYERERQWCAACHKEVVATPPGVVPHSRLGINLIIQVLVWKYVCRMSFEIMTHTLKQTYGVAITTAGLINILKRSQKWLGPEYDQLLNLIRGSPVKHADETSWRIKGLNGWLWAFLTKDAIYLTIEHTRGKGVPQKILADSRETDVLVRDDYAGYKSLKLNHQSCWRHLLGESREAGKQTNASGEVKQLHRKLKMMYGQLDKVTQQPLNLLKRQTLYQLYEEKIKQIIESDYATPDAQAIQTRIKHQGNNLITALLFPDVPLTNNLAERTIRPSVVIRKISGGSRSDLGAQTFAVNMSIIQTIKLRNQSLIPTLHRLILTGATGKN
jgi:hypothetical protein